MPRYFFHIHDGCSIRDPEGTELPDIYVAQAEAVRLSGALLRDLGAKFWDEKDWKLEVTDELVHPDLFRRGTHDHDQHRTRHGAALRTWLLYRVDGGIVQVVRVEPAERLQLLHVQDGQLLGF